MNLSWNRYKVFGHKLFRSILDGYPIHQNELTVKLREYKDNTGNAVPNLDLTVLTVPTEYQSKRMV